LTEEDREVTRITHSCWVSFAKTSKPDCANAPAWPPYGGGKDRLMNINSHPRVESNFHKRQLDAQTAAMTDNIAAQKRSLSEFVGVLEKLVTSHPR
jgi:carboxylesterase type B